MAAQTQVPGCWHPSPRVGAFLDGGVESWSDRCVGVLWLRVRNELRARWKVVIALILLIGIAGGIGLAAGAGARRTASVVTRLRSVSLVYDVNLNPIGEIPAGLWDQVGRLPQVARSAHLVGAIALRVNSDGRLSFDFANAAQVILTDPGYFRDIDRPRLVAGHLPEKPDEAVINPKAADLLHLKVGDRITVRYFGNEISQPGSPAPTVDTGVPGEATIAGVVLSFDDALKDPQDLTLGPIIGFGPAAFHSELAPPYELRAYRLRNGQADVASFVAAARRIIGDNKFVVQDSSAATDRANRSLRPYVFALAVFGLLVSLTGFVVVTQALAREERRFAQDHTSLKALGLTDRQLLASAVLRGSLTAVCGSSLAVLIAVLASSATPFGDARLLETDTGMRLDPFLFVGFGAIIVLVVAAAIASGRAARPRPASRRLAQASARTPSWRRGSPALTVGTSFALDGSPGRSGVSPIRSLSSLILLLAIMAAALVFGANLTRFATTPERYGSLWDVLVAPGDANLDSVANSLAADPDVGTVVRGWFGQVVVGGRTVPAVGLGHGEPGTSIPVIEGRAPTGADEVILGRTTLRSLHTEVGGSIEVAGPDPTRPLTLRVVGVGIFARFAPYPSSEPTGLGVGAALTLEGLTALGQQGGTGNTFFLASAAPGHTLEPSKLETDLFAGDLIQGNTFGRQRPVEVRGYAQMRGMPLLLVAVLGILLLAALAHLLATTALRRSRDLAVLRAIGFTRGQVKGTILVQLLVVLAVVTVVALPVGVVAGAWTWRLTARWLGIGDDTAFPMAALTATVAIMAASGVVIAAISGQRAARRPVQQSLIAD